MNIKMSLFLSCESSNNESWSMLLQIYIYIVSRSKTQMLDQVFLITWKVTGQQISMFLEIMAILCTWKAYLVPAFINEVSDYTCVLILTSKSIVNTCYESIVNINNLTPHHLHPHSPASTPHSHFQVSTLNANQVKGSWIPESIL